MIFFVSESIRRRETLRVRLVQNPKTSTFLLKKIKKSCRFLISGAQFWVLWWSWPKYQQISFHSLSVIKYSEVRLVLIGKIKKTLSFRSKNVKTWNGFVLLMFRSVTICSIFKLEVDWYLFFKADTNTKTYAITDTNEGTGINIDTIQI